MEYLKREHLRYRFIYAFLFAVGSMLFVNATTDYYFKNLDKTEYLKIEQPVSLDKKIYRPCEETILTTKLTAKVDVNIKSITQLVLIKADDNFLRIGHPIAAEAPIKAMATHIISGGLPLPCDLNIGRYYWQGTAEYQVRGIQKDLSFITETFTVASASATTSPSPMPLQSSTQGFTRPSATSGQPVPTTPPGAQPQAGQSGQQTVIINNEYTEEKQPEPTPQPTPQPIPTPRVCLPIVGCL